MTQGEKVEDCWSIAGMTQGEKMEDFWSVARMKQGREDGKIFGQLLE